MQQAVQDIISSRQSHRAFVMGILNVTPDSFSDGGEFFDPAAAIARARQLICDGADILDIGAESTRPGSRRISADEQIARLRDILPAICAIPDSPPISIDTTRAKVADFAIRSGASIINDISAGRDDPEIFSLAGQHDIPIVLMHMLGEPATMQACPQYDDVIAQVREFLLQRVAAACNAGIKPQHCIVDPGIGFGKTLKHNTRLLKHLSQLQDIAGPVLIGPSRKQFIGEITAQATAARRLGGSIAACLIGSQHGATIFRVHDVAQVKQALSVARAVIS